MNFTVYVVDINSLGPAKFFIFMMIYLTAILWFSARKESHERSL